MAVVLVEIPQFQCPAIQRPGGEHPVLVLDRLPHLGGENGQAKGAVVPALAGLLRPAPPRRLVPFGDPRAAPLDPGLECAIAVEKSAAAPGQLRNGQVGVGHDPEIDVEVALIIERPGADLQIAEADIDEAATFRGDPLDLAGGRGKLARRPLPVADIEADDEIGVGEDIAHHAHVQRMAAGKIEPGVEVIHRRLDGFGELHQGIEAGLAAADKLGQQYRFLGRDQHLRRLIQGRRVRGHRRRHAGRVLGRQRHLVIQRRLLEPGVVTHIDRSLGLGHHHRISAGEGLRHAVDHRGLVVPLGVVADLRPLDAGGMDPVDLGAPLGLVHRTGGADDEDRGAVDIGVIDRHVGVDQADQIVDDGHHRLARRLGIAMRHLDRGLLVLAQHHMGIVLAVIDQRIVEPPVTGAGVERRIGHVVAVQHVDDDVGPPAALGGDHLRPLRRPDRLAKGLGLPPGTLFDSHSFLFY